jgi:hypothetical protein
MGERMGTQSWPFASWRGLAMQCRASPADSSAGFSLLARRLSSRLLRRGRRSSAKPSRWLSHVTRLGAVQVLLGRQLRSLLAGMSVPHERRRSQGAQRVQRPHQPQRQAGRVIGQGIKRRRKRSRTVGPRPSCCAQETRRSGASTFGFVPVRPGHILMPPTCSSFARSLPPRPRAARCSCPLSSASELRSSCNKARPAKERLRSRPSAPAPPGARGRSVPTRSLWAQRR